MAKIIEINKLNFGYKEELFHDLDLVINKNTFTTIMGSNSCGKTTLMRIITGDIKTDSNIIIDDIELNNKTRKEIRKKIEIITGDPTDTFICDTVIDDITFSLQSLNYSENIIEKKIEEIVDMLNINNILDKNIDELSYGEMQKVALASILVLSPMILIMDNALSMINYYERIEILKKIKDLNITVLYITDDVNDILISDKIILINDKKIILNSTLKKALQCEKEFNNCNLELPFMADLSKKLGYYGLVDDIILNKTEMVDVLWK